MIDVQILRGALVRASDGRTGRVGSVSLPWVRIEWEQGDTQDVDSVAYRRGSPEVHEEFEILTLDKGWLGMGALLGSRPRGPMAELIADLEACSACADAASLPEDPAFSALLRVPEPAMLPPAHEYVYDKVSRDDEDPIAPGASNPIMRGAGSLGWSTISQEARDRFAGRLLQERSQRHYPFKRKAKLGPGPRKGTLKKANRWDCTCNNYVCSCKGAGDMSGRTKRVDIDKGYKASYNAEYRAWRAKKNMRSQAAKKGHAERAKAASAKMKGKRSMAARKGAANRKAM